MDVRRVYVQMLSVWLSVVLLHARKGGRGVSQARMKLFSMASARARQSVTKLFGSRNANRQRQMAARNHVSRVSNDPQPQARPSARVAAPVRTNTGTATASRRNRMKATIAHGHAEHAQSQSVGNHAIKQALFAAAAVNMKSHGSDTTTYYLRTDTRLYYWNYDQRIVMGPNTIVCKYSIPHNDTLLNQIYESHNRKIETLYFTCDRGSLEQCCQLDCCTIQHDQSITHTANQQSAKSINNHHSQQSRTSQSQTSLRNRARTQQITSKYFDERLLFSKGMSDQPCLRVVCALVLLNFLF